MTGITPSTSTLSVYNLYLLPKSSAAFSLSFKSTFLTIFSVTDFPNPPITTSSVTSPLKVAVKNSSISSAFAILLFAISSVIFSMYFETLVFFSNL